MHSRTRSSAAGFTLIELMIVIAILGILLAIAIPAYQDFTIRAKVSEAVNMASAAKAAVSEYVMSQAAYPISNTLAGLATTVQSQYVERLDVIADGVVQVQLRNIEDVVNGTTILFTPTRNASTMSIDWACNPGTIPARFLPRTCLGAIP